MATSKSTGSRPHLEHQWWVHIIKNMQGFQSLLLPVLVFTDTL